MKKSDIFTMNKAQNSGWHMLFRFSLLVFFSSVILKAPAQCPTVVATPSSTSICSGSTATILLKSDQTETTYSWTALQTGVVGAADGLGSAITNNLSATDATPGSVVYTITPLSKGCKGTPAVITIKVNPTPGITAVPLSSTLISGTASSISLTSDVTETNFSWTVIRSGVSGATDGSGPIISQTISAVAERGVATYHITPNFKGCIGNSINVKVIVKKKI